MSKVNEAGAAPRPGFGDLEPDMQRVLLSVERMLKWFHRESKARRHTPLMSLCAIVLAYCWDHGIDWREQMEEARTRFPFHAIGSAEPKDSK